MTSVGSHAPKTDPKIEWTLRLLSPEQELIKKSLSHLPLDSITLELLLKRGLKDEQSIEKFLYGKLSDFPDPFRLSEMDLAVHRVIKSISQKERVVLFGDYDVDGITGTAQLYLFLKEVGLKTIPILPHRLRDGYGLTHKSLERIVAEKPQLVVTIDNGTKSFNELSILKQKGIDVVVIDHHETPLERPPVIALINPKTPSSSFDEKNIASAGLVFLFLIALRSQLREKGFQPLPNLKKYLDLACLGTVADIVPMTGTNRLIVKYGLQELDQTERPGLIALKEVASIHSPVNVTSIGYRIAPRINAAGRLEDPMSAFLVLTAEDPFMAHEGAQKLEQLNRERQLIEEKNLKEAISMIEDKAASLSGIVVASPNWHLGVVGIIAAKLVDRFQKPSIVLSILQDKNEAKGSARTVRGVSVYQALKKIESSMIHFGGHDAAAGLSVRPDQIETFSQLFDQALQDSMAQRPSIAWYDAELPFKKINLKFMEELEKLSPHGPENEEPVFFSKEVRCEQGRIVGEKHLKLILSQDISRFDAIAFDQGPRLASVASSRNNVIFSPQFNLWNGVQNIQIKIKAFC